MLVDDWQMIKMRYSTTAKTTLLGSVVAATMFSVSGCDSGGSIMGVGTEPLIDYPGDADANITGSWRGSLVISDATPTSNYPTTESLEFTLHFIQTGSGDSITLVAKMNFDVESGASSTTDCLSYGDTGTELSILYDSDYDGDIDGDDSAYTHTGAASFSEQTATSPATVSVDMNLASGMMLNLDGTSSGNTLSGSYSFWPTLGRQSGCAGYQFYGSWSATR